MAPERTGVDLDSGSEDEKDFISLKPKSRSASVAASEANDGGEDDDDYMNMDFTANAPRTKTPETSLQRRQRLKREGENRSRPKSKAELADEAASNRREGLATQLDESNKGFKMMQKLGFKAGAALGKEGGGGRTEPIAVDMKEGRGGIGADAERKRKVREEVERMGEEKKRLKADEGDFVERNRRERMEKRMEAQGTAAMKVCESFEGEGGSAGEMPAGNGEANDGDDDDDDGQKHKRRKTSRPLQSIPVVWRGLVKHRIEQEREKRVRYELNNSIGRGLPTHNDPEDEDPDYKIAMAQEEVELEEDDPDLDGFNALEPEERLNRLTQYLREKHRYCFWCKAQYPDDEFDGCPGLTEEDHD